MADLQPIDAKRLIQFVETVVDFLEESTLRKGIGTAEERQRLQAAVQEFRNGQLERVRTDLLEADPNDLIAAGFSPFQGEYKLRVPEREMKEALITSKSGLLSGKKSVKASNKIKVVFDSLKGLSKWLEALAELADMFGESAKNRLNP